MVTDIYNTGILSLAAELENTRLSSPDATARKISKLCGSWVEIDLNVKAGAITEYALRVQACALGQASAAILQAGIVGADLRDLVAAQAGLAWMLEHDDPSQIPVNGRFSKLTLLRGVSAYSARHKSTLLAFDAAVAAMESLQSKN